MRRKRKPLVPRASIQEFLADYERLGSVKALAEHWSMGRGTATKLLREQGVDTSRASLVRGNPRLGRVPDRILAEELGVRIATVCDARKAAGIPSYVARTGKSTPRGSSPLTEAQIEGHRKRRRFDEQQEKEVLADYRQAGKIRPVAEKWGVPEMTIWRTLRRMGVDTSKKR